MTLIYVGTKYQKIFNYLLVFWPDYMVAPPGDLFYNPQTRTISFSLPGTDFCLRVDIFDGSTWLNTIPCTAGTVADDVMEPSRKVELRGAVVDQITVFNVSASVCLVRRPEICSSSINAKLCKFSNIFYFYNLCSASMLMCQALIKATLKQRDGGSGTWWLIGRFVAFRPKGSWVWIPL